MTECISHANLDITSSPDVIPHDNQSHPSHEPTLNQQGQVSIIDVGSIISSIGRVSGQGSTTESSSVLNKQDDYVDKENILKRPNCSELIEADTRRTSAESTSSEKVGIVVLKTVLTSNQRFRQLKRARKQLNDPYDSLSIESRSRLDGQSAGSIIRRLDSILQQKTIIDGLDKMLEDRTIINKLKDTVIQEKTIICRLDSLKTTELGAQNPKQSEKMSVCGSKISKTFDSQESCVNLLLSREGNRPVCLALMILFANKLDFRAQTSQMDKVAISKNDVLLTLRKRHRKGLLELLCLSVRQYLVMQFNLSQVDKTLKITLLEGSLCEFIENVRIITSMLWMQNQIILPSDEAIDAFITSQITHFKEIREYIERLNGISEAQLHNCFKYLIDQRQIINDRLRPFEERLGRYIDIATYQIDKRLFSESAIFEKYVQLHISMEKTYQHKRLTIVNSWSLDRCFEYLEVEPTYRLIQLHQDNSALRINPYQAAIDEFERANSYCDPSSKLRCLVRAYHLIQQCCLSFYSGEVELDTMDNLLPVLIFVILHSDVKNTYANIKLAEHFVQICVDSSGHEARIITNIFMAMEYISVSWQP